MEPAKRLSVINGLRGIAIIAVFMVHTFAEHISFTRSIAGQIASTGWYGIYLFFMLSGFVLYLPYAGGADVPPKKFYRVRAWRVFPLLLVAGSVSILFYSGMRADNPALWLEFAKLATTLFFFSGSQGIAGNGPFWCLAIGIYLSAAFPMIVASSRRLGPLRLAIIVILLSAIARHLVAWTGLHIEGWAITFLQSLACFVSGIAIAHYYSEGRLNAVIRYPNVMFCISSTLMILLLMSINDVRSGAIGPGWRLIFYPGSDFLLASVVASAVCLQRGPVYHALSFWPLQLIGMMCFSIYVWHMPLLGAIGVGTPQHLLMALYTLSEFSIVAAFAFLSYRFIEFPHKRLRDIVPARNGAPSPRDRAPAPVGS